MNISYYKTHLNLHYFKLGFWLIVVFSVMIGIDMFPTEFDSLFTVANILSLIMMGIVYYSLPITYLAIYPALIILFQNIMEITYAKFSDGLTLGVIDCIYFIVYYSILILAVFLRKTILKLREKYIDTTTALANALDSRDKYTKNHSENVASYAYAIANKLKLHKEICNSIYIGGLLHDVGKIGVPEEILLKPGKLTDEEFREIKKHPTIGYEMIKHIDFYRDSGILDILLYHHERYDGKGYPHGLAGTDIPLVARIVAVADSFDAMNSKRNYRDKMDLDIIISELKKNKGTQFDPFIVDAFLDILKTKKPEELLKESIKTSRK